MSGFLSWLTGKRGPRTEQSLAQPKAESPARDNMQFALDLYLRLKDCAGPYDNVICSPFSTSAALAIAHAGARGQTATQIAHVLRGTAAGGRWQAALAAVRDRLIAGAKSSGHILEIANGLWGPAGLQLRREFSDAAGRPYGAGFRQVDFSQEESARGLINQWAGECTRQLIQVVVARGEITREARLVLITAVCFKGRWAKPFGGEQTLNESFWVAPPVKIVVPMMGQRGRFLYNQFLYNFADRVQVVELPYAGNELSMVLLMPEGTDGIIQFEHALERGHAERLQSWLSGLDYREIDVVLPKFTFGSRFDLHDTLSEMGLADAFAQDAADFTGMGPEQDLFLSRVIHQAVVAVDEAGGDVGAVAATGESKNTMPARPPQRLVPMFRADHPFLFLIRDTVSGQVLFMGRVINPPVPPRPQSSAASQSGPD
jgi:serpin B